MTGMHTRPIRSEGLTILLISFYRSLASISSRVSPFVSGTIKKMKTRDTTAIPPKMKNTIPAPSNVCHHKSK